MVKELGKLTPYVRKKGGPPQAMVSLSAGSQRRGAGDYFSKVQASATSKDSVWGLTRAQCR
jgi:hypothetical protein